MNLWIETARESLLKTIKGVDVVIINDAEARQLTEIPNLIKAARTILSWGPRALIVKRGEFGAALFTNDSYFAIPAYPLESVFDPTGAGDTFAGGFMGYLDSQKNLDNAAMRRAMIFGSVMASFNVEEFGTARVQRLTTDEINERFRAFKQMTHFEEIPFERAVHGVYLLDPFIKRTCAPRRTSALSKRRRRKTGAEDQTCYLKRTTGDNYVLPIV
jgi:pyridoxal/pyridoxine/pyridoxamine kinase